MTGDQLEDGIPRKILYIFWVCNYFLRFYSK
jgi:hypothetical protein